MARTNRRREQDVENKLERKRKLLNNKASNKKKTSNLRNLDFKNMSEDELADLDEMFDEKYWGDNMMNTFLEGCMHDKENQIIVINVNDSISQNALKKIFEIILADKPKPPKVAETDE